MQHWQNNTTVHQRRQQTMRHWRLSLAGSKANKRLPLQCLPLRNPRHSVKTLAT
jgi:hypothetical protein